LQKRKKRRKYTKYGNINKGFTEKELKRFLSSTKSSKSYLAFYLMSHLGLRVSEVVSLRLSDIDFINNKVRISTLKAKTGDFLYMEVGVRKLLKAWVRKYPKEIEKASGHILFSSNKQRISHPISANWLRNEFRETCLISNLNEFYDYAEDDNNPRQKGVRKLHRLTTHSLRHYFITKVYNHCKNPLLTQKLARHRSFKSTEVYININYEKLGKVIEEIMENENIYQQAKKGGAQPILMILGIVGLFIFLIPGIIFIVIAGNQYSKNKQIMSKAKAKINSLEREIIDLKDEKKSIIKKNINKNN